jgi:(p)ppGpp synthase/HD superfamily hydrolase
LVGVVDDNLRGNVVEYNFPDSETMKWCGLSLLKDGVYCFSPKGTIVLVNKAGSQTFESS